MPRNQAAGLLHNPEAATPASVERGKKLYATYCLACHGPGGHGDGPVGKKLMFPPPNLPASLGRFTDGYLYATIRNGGALMPPQGYRIPPVERWHLVNYLRSIAAPGQNISEARPTPASPTPAAGQQNKEKKEEAKGDAGKGKEIFAANCQVCHRADSEEVVVGPGLKGLFHRHVHTTSGGTEHQHTVATVRKQIVEGGGGMPPVGASFTEQQIADLIAYLQTL
jgi:mono/diheme cytochrome c family protein